MILPVHVVAGCLAIVVGFIALAVKKGGTIHRRSGMLFVYAMVVMAATASMLEVVNGGDVTNLVVALLSLYFVGTAVTTVRPESRWTRAINVTALAFALGLAFAAILGGVRNIGNPGLSPGGVPFRTIGVMSFVLAIAMLLAAIGDVRVMRSGIVRGAARLRRHLWRMCFALFIAAGSFFSIRERVARVLPEVFTNGPLRLLPVLLIFGAMFYWMWRLRSRRTLPILETNAP